MAIDPKVDYAFKRLFGSESNKDILIALLDATLKVQVVSLELLNPFSSKDALDDKLSILDVRARLADGRMVNIEMQMTGHFAYIARILYYWSELYRSQLKAGDKYDKLNQTIAIHFVNDRLFPDPYSFHQEFEIRSKEGLVLSDLFVLHTIELPRAKLKKKGPISPFEQWCYFLNHADEIDRDGLPEAITEPKIDKAIKVLKTMFQTKKERGIYEGRLKRARDEAALKSDWEKSQADLVRVTSQLNRVQSANLDNLRSAISMLLEVRFGKVALKLAEQLKILSDESILQQLLLAAKTVASLKEFEKLTATTKQ